MSWLVKCHFLHLVWNLYSGMLAVTIEKVFVERGAKKLFTLLLHLTIFFNVSKRIVEKFRESPFFVHRSHSNMGKNFLVQELLTLFLCDSKEINWQHLSPTVVVYFIRKPNNTHPFCRLKSNKKVCIRLVDATVQDFEKGFLKTY